MCRAVLSVVVLMAAFLGLVGPSYANNVNGVGGGNLEPASVVFSIRPLALLFAELTEWPVADEQIIMTRSQNPHDYRLNLSELKRVQQAGLVFWLGEQHEPSLAKLKQKFDEEAAWLELVGPSHVWLLHGEGFEVFVDGFAQMILQSFPERKLIVEVNKERLVDELVSQSQVQRELFANFQNNQASVLVGHAAFSSWLKESLGLPVLVYRSGHSHGHEHAGSKALLEVQSDILSYERVCAIEEPDLSFVALEHKFDSVNLVRLSPLMAGAPLKKGAWADFWQKAGNDLIECLNGSVESSEKINGVG